MWRGARDRKKIKIIKYKEMSSKFLSFTDYTTLNQVDTPSSVAKFVAQDLGGEPATYCVYSSLVDSVAMSLSERSCPITAVCGTFPSSQSFLEVKLLDVAMAMENGADEIDVVANIGALMEGNIALAAGEIEAIVKEIDGDAVFKVIIESGVLKDEELIYKTSMAMMEVGVDFVKTSTGKEAVGATPEAALAICRAIKDYYTKTGRMVGIKLSGGVRSDEDAQVYWDIVKEQLGEEWLTPALLRFGRSKL